MIILYTLPFSPTCNLIRQKMKEKKIEFQELNFSEVLKKIDTPMAPVVEIPAGKAYCGDFCEYTTVYLETPAEILAWLNDFDWLGKVI